MKEVAFLHQNMAKWQGYEKELSNLEYLSSDKLSNMYIELIEDLSHAQSFYPNSQSTNYLNSLTIRVFEELAKNQKRRTWTFCPFLEN
jgi:CHAD domain-containing protein